MSPEVEKVLAVGFVVVLVAAAWATTSLLSVPETEVIAVEERRVAPDFTRPLLSGPDFVLSEHRGKTVIIDFWATWCRPCEDQMPVLDAIWKYRKQQPGGDDLMIVGVSVDTDPPEKVAAWVAERGFEYPIAFGDQKLSMEFGVVGYPTLMIVDPEGIIHTQHMGILGRPALQEILNAIREEAQERG